MEAQACLDAPPRAAARQAQRLSDAADVSVSTYGYGFSATGARLGASMAVMPESRQDVRRTTGAGNGGYSTYGGTVDRLQYQHAETKQGSKFGPGGVQ